MAYECEKHGYKSDAMCGTCAVDEIAKLRDEVKHLRSAFAVLHDDGDTTAKQRAWILTVLDGSAFVPFAVTPEHVAEEKP